MSPKRRRPIGAERIGDGVDFRVWAPDHRDVAVVIDGADFALEREKSGHFRGFVRGASAGSRYRFRIGDDAFPDPASRFQPEGPHGPSVVIDPSAFAWGDSQWRGIDKEDLVIYEMHIGTFTRQGTWRAAAQKLGPLADIGINLLEVMPIHEFPGRFGWGYDGVDLWAPTRLYGTPDDFRFFVDTAHSLHLGVILDVVYNHFGPDGCYLRKFSNRYFSDRKNEWGEALNFDGPGCEGVREFISENAGYWIEEFHLDGLRLDATQSIHDSSPEHVIHSIVRRANAFVVAENEPQDVALIKCYGVDAMWNDDWHHSAMIAAGGKREAYYTDYKGQPQEFVSMAKHGFLYQGQWYSWQKNRRGTPSSGIERRKFVCYLQNHDQIANSATGARLHHPALTALLLLGPNTPMLFQGQEFAASSPFLYFADHKPELAKAVAKGRREFMKQFPSVSTDQLPAPDDPSTFERCKLDHKEALPLFRELLRLRRELGPWDSVDGAVLSDSAFLLRSSDRLLLINLGRELVLDVVPEPLLSGQWQLLWSSEPGFEEWKLPAESAVLMRSAGVPLA